MDEHVQGVLAGDRAILGRTITLIESGRADHREQAQAVLTALMPHTGGAHRIGITGVPGAGKSTFIESLGMKLVDDEHHVAVLAIDPSSLITGGSILGDKTRMQRLANHPRAFIRPSPTRGALGGVAQRTLETLLVCEAAGFDVVIVESVGVGQSETVLAEMVDFFLLLMLPGTGDELQGIKRGIMELADLVCVNKADRNHMAARFAKAELQAALRLLRKEEAPDILLTSGVTGEGLDQVWAAVEATAADREPRRRAQRIDWTRRLIRERLEEAFSTHPAVKQRMPELEAAVADGTMSPGAAADALLAAFLGQREEEEPQRH